MLASINVSLPQELVSQAEQYVRDGWVADFDSLLAEALSRYLGSHQPAQTEGFVRDDVAWGLHGQE